MSYQAPPSVQQEVEIKAETAAPPEFQLLSACCRVDGSQKDRASEILTAGVDWSQVFELVDLHGVLPLLYSTVRYFDSRLVPAEVLSDLQTQFERNLYRNLRLSAELVGILDCLDAAGVAAIPYKGPSLAESLYGDLALREFSDLDILLRPSEVARAKTALAKIGFVPNIALSHLQEQAYLESGYEYTLDGAAGKNLLELQWNFAPHFFMVNFDVEEVLKRSHEGSVAGRPVRILREEDLLLTLCVHAAKHQWRRLCWLRDIAGLVQISGLDGSWIAREAERLGIRRILEVSLRLAHGLLRARVPENLVLADRQSTTISMEMEHRMASAEISSTETLAYFRSMLRLRERASDRVKFMGRLAFTPGIGEWESVKLPGALWPLYRGVRVARLVGRLLGTR